jgi:hypothetical protein
MQPGQVAAIETDRELAVVCGGQGVGRQVAAVTAKLRRRAQDSQSGGAMDPE